MGSKYFDEATSPIVCLAFASSRAACLRSRRDGLDGADRWRGIFFVGLLLAI